jgi:uncharacterized protein YbjQ (UPF0145 family)
MLCVTMNDIPGWEIQRVCGEVFGVTVRSRNAFSQIGAGFKSMVGGELGGMTKNVIDSRNEAMTRLFAEAQARGGNALVAMRFDTTELGNNWSEICAYGTAVVAVPVTEAARQTAIQLGYGVPAAAQAQPAQAWAGQPGAQPWDQGQGGPAHGAPAQGVPAHGAPAQGVPAHGAPMQGVPAHGAPMQGYRQPEQPWSQPAQQWSEPTLAQPGSAQPSSAQPGSAQPGSEQPGTAQPPAEQPTRQQPITEQPPAQG